MATKLTIRPRTSVTQHGVPLYARIPSAAVQQGQVADIEIVCRNPDGTVTDLTQFDTPTFSVVLGELAYPAMGARPELAATLVADGSDGKIKFSLEAEHTQQAGVFTAEVRATTSAGIAYIYRFYLTINRTNAGTTFTGPPTLAEIRLHLRDSQPEESYLIDELTFDDAEIAHAIARPVEYFNEILPPIGTGFTTTNFPFRYHWLEGIVASLCNIAAEHYRKNRAQYQTQGGAMIDINNREAFYQAEGKRRWEAYIKWAQDTKVNANIDRGYGYIGSPYNVYGYRS